MNETLTTTETATLVQMRAWRKDQMEAMQAAGQWERADEYHEAHIGPLNDELMRRGVW